MQVFVLVVQNSVPIRSMGSATALTQFSRQIGATLGVTLMGVIVNQGLPASVGGGEGAVVHRLPAALRDDLASALQPAFLAAAVLCLVVLVVVLVGIKEVPLRKGLEEPTLTDELGEGSLQTLGFDFGERLHADRGLGSPRALGRQREAGGVLLRARVRLPADRVRGARDGRPRPRLVRDRAGRHPPRADERPARRPRDRATTCSRTATASGTSRSPSPTRPQAYREAVQRGARGVERAAGRSRTSSAASSWRRSPRTATRSTRSSTAETTAVPISPATSRRWGTAASASG